ncbi:hypothetical protein VOLCADRAFT_99294 [Volvox carteri f. nagariensis]|uniref:Uncharacterized protein n=1 Tax=Volvox carteri f. nagariensis TaxID=3068 RepID=D8UHF9_VOLCA|nr:uncharacterized protein VOLCADRAFT_99294 [Volvox carteri f. nagariensis]EFJ40846.1 hypothetical protein VOLCADRAFT_99294 [Volvox carteri f. nagariensis]|eukprot:XP_002958115.1 hypothetical protein VOLCADRAFT_99294 [Volvox carteri f. nagariensis]
MLLPVLILYLLAFGGALAALSDYRSATAQLKRLHAELSADERPSNDNGMAGTAASGTAAAAGDGEQNLRYFTRRQLQADSLPPPPPTMPWLRFYAAWYKGAAARSIPSLKSCWSE